MDMTLNPLIRAINPDVESEVATVAERMRLTLQEVMGEEHGANYYTKEWLRNRLLQHLDADQYQAQVLLAQDFDGTILGHTIVRIEHDEKGHAFGLYSTIYVEPEARRRGIAAQLIQRGEDWPREQGMHRLATDTALDNSKLIQLFEGRGYEVVFRSTTMLRLQKDFA